MMYRHQDLQEGYVHQCSNLNKYTIARRQEVAKIRKHDTKTFMLIDCKIIDIEFCPFCGCKLSEDEENNHFLKLKLE